MRLLFVTLFLMPLLSCGDGNAPVLYQFPAPGPPPPPQYRVQAASTAGESEDCKLARERLAGSDFAKVEQNEQGLPTWEERFLVVDEVVRAKLHSSYPGVARMEGGTGGERYYPVIEMVFRVLEVFKGSVYQDYIVVWQVGWDYYGSYADAQCVRPEDVAALREEYAYLDDREAVLFLKRIRNLEWLESISSYGVIYFLARLPSGLESANLLEDEQWRWLPHYEGDSFYDRKYPADSLESASSGVFTTQELRGIGDKIEEMRYTHDLECVYEAYRRARNFNENLETLMEACARER